ncbi:MAG: alpha/beta hydrolase [Geminicoccaceae bacterium]
MSGWTILLAMLPILGGVLLTVWCLAVVLLWWQQDRMIFPGWGFKLATEASGLAPGDERLAWTMPDGVGLVGGLRRARGPSRGLLLICGGNAEETDWRLRQVGELAPDCDVATFFYRGFGPSGGQPSQDAIMADAALIRDDLVARLRPRRVLAVGFSLGSGVAAQLARLRPLDGLILVTPFDSIAGVAGDRYPWVPVRWLLRHPFRSDRALAKRSLPVAVIGAADDLVVPPARTRRLIAVLRQPVLVRWIEHADHVSIYDEPSYRQAFRDAVTALLADPSPKAAPAQAAATELSASVRSS